jgi:hypothetical protein
MIKEEWSGTKGEGFDFAGSLLYAIALFAIMYGFLLTALMEGGIVNRSGRALPGFLYFSAVKTAFPFIGYTFVFG